MEELIAKKYIKALNNSFDIESLQNAAEVFSTLADSFKNVKFVQVMGNPHVAKEQKLAILLDAVKSANSQDLNNMLKLLVENNRVSVIPAIAEAMRKNVANKTKSFTGTVYSDSDVDTQVINDLGLGLSKKFDSSITLSFVKNDFNGIKVDVEDLGVEINFSKDRINSQIIEHIIKAI